VRISASRAMIAVTTLSLNRANPRISGSLMLSNLSSSSLFCCLWDLLSANSTHTFLR